MMTLPDGYSDIPSGKIAAVVTHLEMNGMRYCNTAQPI